MKWIKADANNLPKPVSHTKANIRYKGNAELLQYINGIWHWYNEPDHTAYPVKDESWEAIEFLDEPQVQPTEKKTKEEIIKNINNADWSSHTGDPLFSYAQLESAMEEYALQQSPWEVIGPKALEALREAVYFFDNKIPVIMKDPEWYEKALPILKQADEPLKDK